MHCCELRLVSKQILICRCYWWQTQAVGFIFVYNEAAIFELTLSALCRVVRILYEQHRHFICVKRVFSTLVFHLGW